MSGIKGRATRVPGTQAAVDFAEKNAAATSKSSSGES